MSIVEICELYGCFVILGLIISRETRLCQAAREYIESCCTLLRDGLTMRISSSVTRYSRCAGKRPRLVEASSKRSNSSGFKKTNKARKENTEYEIEVKQCLDCGPGPTEELLI